MDKATLLIIPLLIGWIADRLLGDPPSLPHPVVLFGKIISKGEKLLNKGTGQLIKGGVFSLVLIAGAYFVTKYIQVGLAQIHPITVIVFNGIIVFFCLAGKTLIKEVKAVFVACERSVEDGRNQVSRIVGRDTSQLSLQQIKKAALETLSENLSDGVIAPLFWYLILGVPGMVAYKMINTLDSMIGYKNVRYKNFGCWAAYIDDIANYIPARLTAFLMILVNGKVRLISFIARYGSKHASPNSGYPEAALAGILNCRFGGPNYYFGELVDKPYIGENDRPIEIEDALVSIVTNQRTEAFMVIIIVFLSLTEFFPIL
ncbi:adenosylcobinamide-phosphate synthase CbiB [Dysgonomonas macrotermitis]|uniref:Cobalamin biosynthesis protein CobD n=1 Tax=Dysgonomonas macrotermitis TaxID=1346286 RepID=A0A1M4X009_9BACT|nr:adenosylcobinamide-phosphate synthase CbiB [Dysgonomonas macrotermitis]SHE86653.1 adenosylcobinamide-phosphate synthase [Dysgonomonas macrotermitis]